MVDSGAKIVVTGNYFEDKTNWGKLVEFADAVKGRFKEKWRMVHNNANSNKRLKLIDGVVLALSLHRDYSLSNWYIQIWNWINRGYNELYRSFNKSVGGEGFVGLGGTPFVLWPPGYSLIILFVRSFDRSGLLLNLSSLNILSLSLTFILSYLIFKQNLNLPSYDIMDWDC
ncbi:MAG: hypothetical protein IPG53_16120 [Ignavibacteriales bacterium]|nr:hypothetical protein [Ignavibacteriales bacterium]